MASLLLLHITPSMHAFSSPSSNSLSTFANKKPSKVSTYGNHYCHRYNNISCKSTNDSTNNDDQKFDRRNVLLGLGGLYGIAANLDSTNQSAIALPVPGPDIDNCGEANTGGANPQTIQYSCCPTKGTPVPYVIPKWSKTRIRPAAQWATTKHATKYSKAIKTMKSLPKDDPHNFWNQAEIHCAYCNGAYKQLGYPDKELQVHYNWLFLPFHRWYLYFFERIVAKYIRDDGEIDEDFALPFWNFDNPNGMMIPPIYLDFRFELNDCYRNANHLDKLVDLHHGDSSGYMSNAERIADNLRIMHATMIDNSHGRVGLFGEEFSGGKTPPTQAGSLERTHNLVHKWVGDPNQPYNEDMGNFYSSAKDPIFYGLHANVDRLWCVWKDLKPRRNKDPKSNDWKNSSFLFYDENKKLVTVTVRDCIDPTKLGYKYEPVDNGPWQQAKSIPKVYRSTLAARSASTGATNVVFPVLLNKVVQVLVKRPSKSRSKEEKDKADEILLLEGIKFTMDKFVQFDVYVNDEDEKDHAKPSNTEYLGSFSSVPHRGMPGMEGTAKLSLGLTTALEDLEADGDDSVVIKLVPREGAEDVTVDTIKIELCPRE